MNHLNPILQAINEHLHEHNIPAVQHPTHIAIYNDTKRNYGIANITHTSNQTLYIQSYHAQPRTTEIPISDPELIQKTTQTILQIFRTLNRVYTIQ